MSSRALRSRLRFGLGRRIGGAGHRVGRARHGFDFRFGFHRGEVLNRLHGIVPGGHAIHLQKVVTCLIEARGNHRYAHLVAKGFIDNLANDNIRVRIHRFLDHLGGGGKLLHTKVRTGQEGNKYAVCTVDGGFQQRGGNGALGSAHRPIFPGGRTNTHEGGARVLHNGLDVREVEVNQTWNGNKIRNSLDARAQHLIGEVVGLNNGEIFLGDLQQAIIGDNNEGIHRLAQFRDTHGGVIGTLGTFKFKGTGHDADSQRSQIPSHLGNHGGGTGAGPSAFTSSDEHHIRAFEGALDNFHVFFRGALTHRRIRTRSQALRNLATNIEFGFRFGFHQGLPVGVNGNKFHTGKSVLNHAVNSVDTAPADPDDFDIGGVIDYGHEFSSRTSSKT